MSNQILNYHILDGSPAGEDAGISEIADYYGGLLFEIRPIKKQNECQIFGSEITFEKIVSMDQVKDVCRDIWEYPNEYFDCGGNVDAYYSFLKFLWVKFPDGSEKRLVDFIEE